MNRHQFFNAMVNGSLAGKVRNARGFAYRLKSPPSVGESYFAPPHGQYCGSLLHKSYYQVIKRGIGIESTSWAGSSAKPEDRLGRSNYYSQLSEIGMLNDFTVSQLSVSSLIASQGVIHHSRKI